MIGNLTSRRRHASEHAPCDQYAVYHLVRQSGGDVPAELSTEVTRTFDYRSRSEQKCEAPCV
jgi:hypothetical protein